MIRARIVLAAALTLYVGGLCHAAPVPRPDLSTEKDSVFFDIPSDKVRLIGPVKLEAPRPGLEWLKQVAAIPPQRFPAEPPGLELDFRTPSHGYYTVSAHGYPQKALWRGDDFIWFVASFGDKTYTAKTGEPGEGGGADAPGAYHELCRFYFIAPAAGTYRVKLLVRYCPVPVYIHRIEIRHVDAHFSATPLKKAATMYSQERIAKLREAMKAGDQPFPRLADEAALKVSDEELWNGIPDWTSMRPFWHNFDCPVHGADIRKKHSIYPWITSRQDGKWGVTCPIGGETYPSNDYRAGDLTSGAYPDDGMGWYDADHKAPAAKDYQLEKHESQHGPNYFFVGLHAHELLRGAGEKAKSYAASYIRTGNADYAHKAAVLLVRMAYIYPCMDWTYQSTEGCMWYRPDAIHVRRGRCTQWAVESQILNPLIETYDILYDHLGKDAALLEFVRARVPWVKTFDDLRLLVDRNILQLGYDAAACLLDRYGAQTWFVLGEAANNPNWFRKALDFYTVQTWTEPVMTGVTNLLNRNGNSTAPLFSYDFNNLQKLAEMAQAVQRFGEPLLIEFDFWRGEPFAKWRAALETWPRYLVAGDHMPNMGDAPTSPVGTKARTIQPVKYLEIMRPWYAMGYRWLRTPFYAYYAGGAAGKQYLRSAPAEIINSIEADAAKYQPRPLRTRSIPGPGLCILEAHPASAPPARSAICCRYGVNIAEHSHQDCLNVEFFAKGIDMAPDFGWPPDTSAPSRHNLLATEDYEKTAGGWLRALADGPGCYFADLSGLPGKKSLDDRSHSHRRALCLVEVGDGDSYLFDLSRARTDQGPHTLYWHGTQGSLDLSTSAGPLAAVELDKPQEFQGQLIATWRVDMQASGAHEYYKDSQLYLRELVLPAAGRTVIKTKVNRPDFPSSFIVGVQDSSPPAPGAKKDSLFAAVLEPYERAPFIQEAVELSPQSAADRLPRAYRVMSRIPGRGARQADYHLFAAPGIEAQAERVSLSGGAYALYQETDGQLSRALVCGNSEIPGAPVPTPVLLNAPGIGLELSPGLYQGKVTSVDWKASKVRVAGKIPLSAAGGSVLLVSPAGRITNYNVVSVAYDQAANASELVLEHLYPIFVGDVAELDAEKGLIRTKIQPRFGVATVHHYAYGRFLDGAYLVDEARTAQAALAQYGPVEGKEGLWFRLADAKQIAVLKDAAGPSFGPLGTKEHLVFVYDVGVGDAIYFVPWAAAVRNADGSYLVKGTGQVTLTLPGRFSVSARDARGAALKLEVEVRTGTTAIRVPLGELGPDGAAISLAAGG